MATYKQGCTDKDMVRKIQTAVGVTADGIWGAKTTEAVKAWQRKHGITADGIVGERTLAAMRLSEKQSNDSGIDITKSPLSKHITRYRNRAIKYIAIHYTAGSKSTAGQAMNARQVFLQRPASADFVVDDKLIVQCTPDIRDYYCWAIGDKKKPSTGGGSLYGKATNRNTISIEICSTLRQGTSASAANHDGWSFSDAVLERLRQLVRYLMRQYGIPRTNVIRHYDATGKLCPGLPGWNDGLLFTTDGKQTKEKNNSKEWEAFLASI